MVNHPDPEENFEDLEDIFRPEKPELPAEGSEGLPDPVEEEALEEEEEILPEPATSVVNDEEEEEEILPEKEFSSKAKEDFRLVERAQQSEDQEAYAQLLKRYRRPVYHLVYKMVRNQHDAEDLTIEAFAKAFRNLKKFNPDFTFSTWLFRIATNNCIDFIRKKRLKTMSLDNTFADKEGDEVRIQIRDYALNPQEEAIRKQKIDLIQTIVNKLPEKYLVLVKLRYFEELSYEEIAEELDSPLGTVKAQLHRAREILLDMMRNKRDNM